MPSSDIQRLAAAVVLALGIGTGGGSLIHREPQVDVEALLEERDRFAAATFASQADVSEMTTQLALIKQELVSVSAKLVEMSQQIDELHRPARERHR